MNSKRTLMTSRSISAEPPSTTDAEGTISTCALKSASHTDQSQVTVASRVASARKMTGMTVTQRVYETEKPGAAWKSW